MNCFKYDLAIMYEQELELFLHFCHLVFCVSMGLMEDVLCMCPVSGQIFYRIHVFKILPDLIVILQDLGKRLEIGPVR